MRLDPNDSNFTVFNRRKLDEGERVAIEHDLVHPDAAPLLEETARARAGLLGEEHHREPRSALAAEQQSAIKRKLQPDKSRDAFTPSRVVYLGSLIAAAGLCIVAYLGWLESAKTAEN